MEVNSFIEPGFIVGVIILAARWLKSDVQSLKSDMGMLEQRLSREHADLHGKVNDGHQVHRPLRHHRAAEPPPSPSPHRRRPVVVWPAPGLCTPGRGRCSGWL